MKPLRTLYICYFGLREPLVQTQVLPYLRTLAAGGLDVYLLTFEPEFQSALTASNRAEQRAKLAGERINWFALPYHKRPSLPATLYDIAAGAKEAVRLLRKHDIDVIHARAHVPMAMALLAQKVTGCRLVFDIRGLMAEEYADAGVWAEGSLKFRAIKKLERAGIKRADQIVVLTRAMRDWLLDHSEARPEQIEVIPCCVDFARYSDAVDDFAQEQSEAERFEVIYAGSVTGLYLLAEMARFFLAVRAREPKAFLRILTMSNDVEAAAQLRRVGLTSDQFWVGKVSSDEVPRHLSRARLGLSFRKPTFSQIAASPTKIPEYLAAGLPVVSNAGIGDVESLLETERVGIIVREFNAAELAHAAESALALANEPGVGVRCVEVAKRHFHLQTVGGRGYGNVYHRLADLESIINKSP